MPFGYDTALKTVPEEQDKIEDLKLLNIMFQSQGGEAVINSILDNPEQMKMISEIILAQDRMANTHGYIVNRWWAEEFKYEALKRAINALKGYDFIFLQMEYQLSSKFLEEFKSHLKSMGLNEGESIYATGQLAKLQMAGGLGSFKPDLVRGYFDVLKKFWGEIEAKNRLHALGIFYTKAIRGEGMLVADARLNKIGRKLREVRYKREQESIVRELTQLLDEIREAKPDDRTKESLKALVDRIEIIISLQTRNEMVQELRELFSEHKDSGLQLNLMETKTPELLKIQNVILNVLKKCGGDGFFIHELVYVALDAMEYVSEFKGIPIGAEGMGDIDAQLYRNPFSELHEYWVVNPLAFHEPYPGLSDDHFRPYQTFVYKEVLMRLLYFLSQKKFIGDKLLFSSSEVSTALANLNTVDTNLENYPPQARSLMEKIFAYLKKLDRIDHLYNHTIVSEGVNGPPSQKFYPDKVRLSPEFHYINHKINTDLRLLTALTNDFFSGCSDRHSEICKKEPGLYKDFAYKFKVDSLFGNTEGSDIERWQGKEIKKVIAEYMDILIEQGDLDENLLEKYVSPYPLFFLALTLDKNTVLLENFKYDMSQAKQKQKQRFIDALKEGTFALWDNGINEHKGQINSMEKKGIELINRPFFTFVRRLVTYKCVNNIVDTLIDNSQTDADIKAQQELEELQGKEDENLKQRIEELLKQLENPGFREHIIASKAMIFIGGRDFDDWGRAQYERLKAVMDKDKRLYDHVIFIANHNVSTSYLIQQGTDFGGMLSWRGKEAGPTSISNSGLNWTNKFGTLDGMLIERLIPIKRDENGKIVKGTGYKVDYVSNQAIPDMNSFVLQLEKACKAYYEGNDYNTVAFNNLWIEMTQGDIRNQVSGLLMIYGDYLKNRKQRREHWSSSIEKFVHSIGKTTFNEILVTGRNNVEPFEFPSGVEAVAENPGLEGFLITLKRNAKQGGIYDASDFESYVKVLLDNLPSRKGIFTILEEINASSMVLYDKQALSIELFEMLVKRLKRGKHYSLLLVKGMTDKKINAIESFVWSLHLDSINMLLKNGEEKMGPFGFNMQGIKNPQNAGLEVFLETLKEIKSTGKVYENQDHLIPYFEGLLKHLKNKTGIIAILMEIQAQEKKLSEKQDDFIAFFGLLVDRLKFIKCVLYEPSSSTKECVIPSFPNIQALDHAI